MAYFMRINSGQLASLSAVFVILAALFWGLSGGIAALLMEEGWDALVVSFYRGAIGLLFVLGWLALRPRQSGLDSGRLWCWSIVAGLGVAGNFSFYFLSISEGSVAVAATLMYCAPVFVYLISFALKLEKPGLLKWVAMLLVMLGIIMLTGVLGSTNSVVSTMGVVAGLLSGLSYAVFIFGFKYAGPHGSPQAILVIAFSTLCVSLIGLIDTDQALAVLNDAAVPLFLILGVFGGGVSFLLYIAGLNYTAPSVAAVVAMVEPVTASLFGVLVLNQSLTELQITGMVLILLTVTALSIYSGSQRLPDDNI